MKPRMMLRLLADDDTIILIELDVSVEDLQFIAMSMNCVVNWYYVDYGRCAAYIAEER